MSKDYDVIKETIERLAALNTHLINKGDAFDEKDAADVDAAIISFRSGHRPPYDLSVEADRIGESRYTELFYSKANHTGLNQDARETIGHMIGCLSR